MSRREQPVADGVLAEFAAGLRAGAGSPPYRELGRQAHYSAATSSEAASGRRLPTLAVTLAYVRACGGDTAEWECRWHALARKTAVEVSENGALSLAAYQSADAGRFHGREQLTEDPLARLERPPDVTVRDLGSGVQITVAGSNGAPNVALAPDGRSMAVSRRDERHVTVQEVPSGRVLTSFPVGDERVSSVVFAPDRRTVALSSSDALGHNRASLRDSVSGADPGWAAGVAWSTVEGVEGDRVDGAVFMVHGEEVDGGHAVAGRVGAWTSHHWDRLARPGHARARTASRGPRCWSVTRDPPNGPCA